eukprot:Pgem_evm1s8245
MTYGCDFQDDGQLGYQNYVPDKNNCFKLCKQTTGCEAVAWNDYKDGTCWFKTRNAQRISKNNVYCAQVSAPQKKICANQPPQQKTLTLPVFPISGGISSVKQLVVLANCQDSNSKVSLKKGKYSRTELTTMLKSISQFSIPDGVLVTLFSQDNFQGSQKSLLGVGLVSPCYVDLLNSNTVNSMIVSEF